MTVNATCPGSHKPPTVAGTTTHYFVCAECGAAHGTYYARATGDFLTREHLAPDYQEDQR